MSGDFGVGKRPWDVQPKERGTRVGQTRRSGRLNAGRRAGFVSPLKSSAHASVTARRTRPASSAVAPGGVAPGERRPQPRRTAQLFSSMDAEQVRGGAAEGSAV